MGVSDQRMNPARSAARAASELVALPRGLAWIWSSLVASGLFWFFRTYGYDDPYITYRYASNLAHGAGFVFNAAFDLSLLDYGTSYDNTQSCSAMFATYLDDLARDLVEDQGLREVGL